MYPKNRFRSSKVSTMFAILFLSTSPTKIVDKQNMKNILQQKSNGEKSWFT